MKVSGWRFDKVSSMTLYFYKTGELNGSNYVKIPSRSNAILKIENIDKHCFLWSILVCFHPCNYNHPNRVSKYKENFIELNIHDFDFTNGFKCGDVHIFEKLNDISITIFDLNFYQDQKEWRQKLKPIEVSKNEIYEDIDLLNYKNHYALIKKLDVSLEDHNKKFICRHSLSSYTRENMLMLHEQK